MGLLQNDTFKQVKRADLIAGYLGQTAIKTQKVIDECEGVFYLLMKLVLVMLR